MKIEKAIELLDQLIVGADLDSLPDHVDALKLAREALKQMKAERTIYGFKRHVKMLGETEK